MTQIKPESGTLLRSAKAFMDEHIIEAIWLEGSEEGNFADISGIGFLSHADGLFGIDIEDAPFELGEILVSEAGYVLDTPEFIRRRMYVVEGFIASVIQPVRLAIEQAYSEGKTLSDSRFMILGIQE